LHHDSEIAEVSKTQIQPQGVLMPRVLVVDDDPMVCMAIEIYLERHAELGVVEDIVRQSGGHLEVRSEAGGGTSVKIYLPRAKAVARSPDEADSERGDEAVLIVEDDALVREYVVGQVQSLGYRVLAAGNAREAMTLIDDGESIDLLFTDVMISGPVNGRQPAIEAVGRRPLLKVLYTSGYADSALAQQGHLEAGVLLLAKPYRKVELRK